ncbi:hypothetical protein AB7C87_23905 [Natrarchaeobius sp. A-rgal3]|uniref:hypothetical protein n=1 Tax=Natrarchaeobius versutus TaxID=1679078 RepID=UPI00350FE1BE
MNDSDNTTVDPWLTVLSLIVAAQIWAYFIGGFRQTEIWLLIAGFGLWILCSSVITTLNDRFSRKITALSIVIVAFTAMGAVFGVFGLEPLAYFTVGLLLGEPVERLAHWSFERRTGQRDPPTDS